MICKVKPPHQEILTEALLALEKDRAKVQVKIVLNWTSIHSKSEDSGIYYPAKKFELSANFFKNATKWPKKNQNGPKWPKYDPKWPKMALE